jgi:hypothetical protein
MKLPHFPTNRELLYLIISGTRDHHLVGAQGAMPGTPLSELQIKDYWRLLLPYAGMIIFGFILAFVSHVFSWHEIVMKLGDAFMIAGILAIGIELFSQNRLMQRVADELAGRLAGNGLPDLLQQQIGDLTRVTLVRTDYKKVYRFEEPRDGRVTICLTISFTVVNFGRKVEEYQPWVAEETFYKPRFLSLEYQLFRDTGNTRFSFDEQQLKSRQEERVDTHALEVKGDAITIPRWKDEPNTKCKVVIRYKVTMPEEYSDISSFSLPAIGLTIELEELPKGFRFVAGSDAEHDPGSTTWTFNRSFINGQHVRTWWFRTPMTPVK